MLYEMILICCSFIMERNALLVCSSQVSALFSNSEVNMAHVEESNDSKVGFFGWTWIVLCSRRLPWQQKSTLQFYLDRLVHAIFIRNFTFQEWDTQKGLWSELTVPAMKSCPISAACRWKGKVLFFCLNSPNLRGTWQCVKIPRNFRHLFAKNHYHIS